VGQKIHPYGFRLGIIYPWKSNWYANRRDYIEALHEDIWIRKHIRSRLSRAGISSIDIERKGDQIWVYIRTARPGIVIGRKGAEVDRLRKDVERYTKKRVDVKVEDMNQASSEVRPDTDATLLAQGVAEQLAGRVAFRRAMRRAVQTAMRAGALGVRVACAGRLGGTDMGRKEWYREGRVPLHTLRAKVDFGTAAAKTTFGAIGVKVWVYHGDEVPHREQETERALARAHARAEKGERGAITKPGGTRASVAQRTEPKTEPAAVIEGAPPLETAIPVEAPAPAASAPVEIAAPVETAPEAAKPAETKAPTETKAPSKRKAAKATPEATEPPAETPVEPPTEPEGGDA
jgi:small subunit ribosomal protein S3